MVEKEQSEHAISTSVLWSRIAAMLVTIVLVAAVFTLVAFFGGGAASSKREVPHIIFILADDLGWNDVSFHGSPQIPTPNIDALAASGIVLNNYYTHALCSPSRGAFMSGKYAYRLGMYEDLKPAQPLGLPLNIPILPEYLKKLGYKTHMIGKWHLGYHKKEYLPTRRGFDSFFGFMNDYIDYFDYTTYSLDKYQTSEEKKLFGVDLWENEEIITDFRGEYATDVFTQKAIEVIEKHNKTKPLFLFVSHAACHTGNTFFPLQSSIEQTELNGHITDLNRRNYAGMVSSLDDSVGKVFQSLREKDLISKSIIIFSSDNGASVGSGSNWPLRGQKGFGWEGGVRSPTIVWSPILKLKRPRVSNNLIHITDWLPTFYRLSGGDISDLGDIDGLDIWINFLDENALSPRDEVFVHNDPRRQEGSLRIGDMKLLLGLNTEDGSDWYGPSGLEETYFENSFDNWVWKNETIIKDILIEDRLWLLGENDTWRQDATTVCGENFLPVSGRCDFTEGPCLYNITDDPCEYKNIAKIYPEAVVNFLDRFRTLNASSLIPPDIQSDPLGDPMCHNFAHVPWLDDEIESECTMNL